MRGLRAIVLCALLLCQVPTGTAEPIDECGILSVVYACVAFDPLSGDGQYLLDIAAIPDSLLDVPVRVSGDAEFCDEQCDWYPFAACIDNSQISECEPQDLGCGVLTGPHWDNSCFLWNSPTYGSLLAGLHGHSSGDTVRAVGIPDYRCATWCPASGCLWYEVYYDCPDTNTATAWTSWGTVKMQFR